MKNVKILDCTLRDGGRLFDCVFPDETIKQISNKLADAKIDIVELGFLRDWRDVAYQGNSTFFTDVEQIKPFINKNKASMYVAFVDYGMFDFDSLKPYDGASVDGLRIGFTKKDFDHRRQDVMEKLEQVKRKGYRLFVQGINSLNYSDREFLDLIDFANRIDPDGFGIVDTYGSMYTEDIHRLFELADNNLLERIAIDFHSHNNYQLSFASALDIIKLCNGKRPLIIDGTLQGIGKQAGNLCTELIAEYMARKMDYDYDLDTLLDIIDEYIYEYAKSHTWGYSLTGLLSGVYKSHPNNVIYLLEKFRLDTKDIKYILSMMDDKARQTYDYDLIEQLYIEYVANKVDDSDALAQLTSMIHHREVLALVPGDSLGSHREQIAQYIQNHSPFIISVNFKPDNELKADVVFYGNQKRYNHKSDNELAIISSNVNAREGDPSIVANYSSLLSREGKYFDNSTIMLFNLLKRIGIKKLSIAGFDGYFSEKDHNYYHSSLEINRHQSEYDKINKELMLMFTKFANTVSGSCAINFVTPSMFEKAIIR